MPAVGTHVASTPAWLPIQARWTRSPSRAWSALAMASPAAVCPPVPPPAMMTDRGAAGADARSPPAAALGAGTRLGLARPGRGQPALLRLPLESERDQPVDERSIGEPAGLPETRVGREAGESGDGVDLVDPDPIVVGEEEVDARETGGVDRPEGRDRQPLELGGEGRGQRSGDEDLRDAVGILGLVVVPLAPRQDLSRHRGLRGVVAEDAHLDFAPRDAALD